MVRYRRRRPPFALWPVVFGSWRDTRAASVRAPVRTTPSLAVPRYPYPTVELIPWLFLFVDLLLHAIQRASRTFADSAEDCRGRAFPVFATNVFDPRAPAGRGGLPVTGECPRKRTARGWLRARRPRSSGGG